MFILISYAMVLVLRLRLPRVAEQPEVVPGPVVGRLQVEILRVLNRFRCWNKSPQYVASVLLCLISNTETDICNILELEVVPGPVVGRLRCRGDRRQLLQVAYFSVEIITIMIIMIIRYIMQALSVEIKVRHMSQAPCCLIVRRWSNIFAMFRGRKSLQGLGSTTLYTLFYQRSHSFGWTRRAEVGEAGPQTPPGLGRLRFARLRRLPRILRADSENFTSQDFDIYLRSCSVNFKLFAENCGDLRRLSFSEAKWPRSIAEICGVVRRRRIHAKTARKNIKLLAREYTDKHPNYVLASCDFVRFTIPQSY